jgi:signal peptidase II
VTSHHPTGEGLTGQGGAGGSPATAAAVVASIAVVDQVTKQLAVERLSPAHVPHEVVGEYLRFTLTYNPGAAFGMHLGSLSRWIFAALTVVIVGFLVRLFRATPRDDAPLRLAVATVMGGAIGNLIDRFRSPLGVVDFIDVGVGDVRFWTFNVADMAVSVGAVCLVVLLWRRDLEHAAPGHPAHVGPQGAAQARPHDGDAAADALPGAGVDAGRGSPDR